MATDPRAPQLRRLRADTTGRMDPRVHAAVEVLGELPVLDRSLQRVVTLARDDESSTTELVRVLENDQAFAANLLRFAHSAYASRPVRAKTIRQAVMLAGRDHIA